MSDLGQLLLVYGGFTILLGLCLRVVEWWRVRRGSTHSTSFPVSPADAQGGPAVLPFSDAERNRRKWDESFARCQRALDAERAARFPAESSDDEIRSVVEQVTAPITRRSTR